MLCCSPAVCTCCAEPQPVGIESLLDAAPCFLTHTWQVYVFRLKAVLSSSHTSICLPALAFPCVAQVYVFHSATLKAVLSANEKLKHLEEQLVPHMIRYQVGTWLAWGPADLLRAASFNPGARSLPGAVGCGLADNPYIRDELALPASATPTDAWGWQLVHTSGSPGTACLRPAPPHRSSSRGGAWARRRQPRWRRRAAAAAWAAAAAA